MLTQLGILFSDNKFGAARAFMAGDRIVPLPEDFPPDFLKDVPGEESAEKLVEEGKWPSMDEARRLVNFVRMWCYAEWKGILKMADDVPKK